MAGLDYAVIAIVSLSALLGLWRGLVYEALSLAGWGLAYLAARIFAPAVAQILPLEESFRMPVACIGVFVVALVVCGIVAWMLSKAVKLAGLGWMDASLGLVFGTARGALIVLALVLLAGMTELPQQPFWREAQLRRPLEQVALAVKEKLPPAMARQVHY
ncbi:MAG: CvpA family protein [Gallionellaceae bacterium]|jgi:membrane protein required for colicin V production|nr:CvpA family protein [Gallionellaceae bacterium]